MVILINLIIKTIGLTIGILLGLLMLLVLKIIPFLKTFKRIFNIVVFSFARPILFLRNIQIKIHISRLNKRVNVICMKEEIIINKDYFKIYKIIINGVITEIA